MAIPQGRLSTEVVRGKILEPEDRPYYGLISYEKGPIAIQDTTQGLLYQNWTMNWDATTGNLNVTPETVGEPQTTINVPNLLYFTFTFDQAGRISIAYTNTTSSYLYWYDTALGYTVTTNLGTDVITPTLNLDDKRRTQSAANDMLLWYLKGFPGNYSLWMLRQRDRFNTPYLMISGITDGNILTVGMGDNLRVHLKLSGSSPIPVPDVIEGLTPLQILAMFDFASQIGNISLYQFPQTDFDTVFGQSIDAGDTTQVIATGQSITFTATVPNMVFRIEHSPVDAGEVITLLCFPNGLIGGSNHYVGVVLLPGVYLPIQPGYPYVFAVASDTGFAKITKETL